MTSQVTQGLALATRSWILTFTALGVASDPTNISVTLARLDSHGNAVTVETKTKADLTTLGVGVYRYTTTPGKAGKYQARITTSGDPYTTDGKIEFEVPTTFAGAQ